MVFNFHMIIPKQIDNCQQEVTETVIQNMTIYRISKAGLEETCYFSQTGNPVDFSFPLKNHFSQL